MRPSAPQPCHGPHGVLVGRVGVDGCCQRAGVAGEPLRQEEIPRGPVDVRDCRVAKGMEGVDAIQPGLLLPRRPRGLHPPDRQPAPRLGAEQWRVRLQVFPPAPLEPPQGPKLGG